VPYLSADSHVCVGSPLCPLVPLQLRRFGGGSSSGQRCIKSLLDVEASLLALGGWQHFISLDEEAWLHSLEGDGSTFDKAKGRWVRVILLSL